ncbi:hypothetical protein SALBM311S_13016 [Streptomyces alboniger]
MDRFARALPAALMAIPGPDGTVTFIRQLKGPYANNWLLPGGGIEPGEPAEAAALREAREETGIAVRSCSLFVYCGRRRRSAAARPEFDPAQGAGGEVLAVHHERAQHEHVAPHRMTPGDRRERKGIDGRGDRSRQAGRGNAIDLGRTRKARVSRAFRWKFCLIYLAGVFAATSMGKMTPISVALRADLSLSLAQVALLTSLVTAAAWHTVDLPGISQDPRPPWTGSARGRPPRWARGCCGPRGS